MPSPDKLATALGWASVALGTPQTLAPGRFARAVGLPDDDDVRRVVVGPCGLREHAAAAGILLTRGKFRTAAVSSRVAGDVLDAAMLVRALRGRSEEPQRTAAALAGVAAVTAVDVYATIRLAKRTNVPTRHAITIRGERSEVEQRWRAFSDATVEFRPAPGSRGTEIHGEGPIKDDLRRFKQLFETGEVVVSDGTPEGQHGSRQLKQRPAQPLEEAVR